MVEGVLALQGILVGAILCLGASAKLISSPVEIDRTGLVAVLERFVPRAVPHKLAVWRLAAVVEGFLGLLFLSGLARVFVSMVGTVVLAMFAVYGLWIAKWQPGLSCGCLGTNAGVSWKTVTRAGVLCLMSMAYGFSESDVGGAPAAVAVVAAIEIALLVALSDEVRPFGRRVRLALARAGRRIGIGMSDVGAVRRRIEAQEFWAWIVEETQTEPVFRDSWMDDRWFICEYSSTWDALDVVVVAAEYLGVHPPWIRIVVLSENGPLDGGSIPLAGWDSAAAARDRMRATARVRSQPLTAPI